MTINSLFFAEIYLAAVLLSLVSFSRLAHCLLPMKTGSCKAYLLRYFYNVTSERCDGFVYGGCESNSNNFETTAECEAACVVARGSDRSTPAPPPAPPAPPASHDPPSGKSTPMVPPAPDESDPKESFPLLTDMSAEDRAEHCEAEPEVGPCKAAIQRWYYNQRTGSCQSFFYGGCVGNKNNYQTEESCVSTCTVTVPSSLKKIPGDDDFCYVTPDPGPCRAAFPMYYYDPLSASCQLFMYGGCRGNANRFGTVEECLSRCSADGEFDGRNQRRSRWTAAVFLFVTLAIISVLLLATLIIVTLRRNRLPRRLSSVSDKEELLPDEQSSVDSLSLPESPAPPQMNA